MCALSQIKCSNTTTDSCRAHTHHSGHSSPVTEPLVLVATSRQLCLHAATAKHMLHVQLAASMPSSPAISASGTTGRSSGARYARALISKLPSPHYTDVHDHCGSQLPSVTYAVLPTSATPQKRAHAQRVAPLILRAVIAPHHEDVCLILTLLLPAQHLLPSASPQQQRAS